MINNHDHYREEYQVIDFERLVIRVKLTENQSKSKLEILNYLFEAKDGKERKRGKRYW